MKWSTTISVLLLVSCCCAVHGLKDILDKKAKLFHKDKTKTPTIHVITIDDSSEETSTRKPVFVDRCSRNEVWYSCLPSCALTCDNLSGSCKSSSSKCLKGCDCARGYARLTATGPCVPVSKCPRSDSDEEEQCSKNEIYTTCGSSCEENCNDGKNICPQVCEKGCFCKPGYSRIFGKCVPDKYCFDDDDDNDDNTCDRNESYMKCGNHCLENCNLAAILCPQVCEKGCFCKSGYARVEGRCVSREQCSNEPGEEPTTCGNNEVYTECGNSCVEKCTDGTVACTYQCQIGCFCKPGYSRLDGSCIRSSECPRQGGGGGGGSTSCSANEYYDRCGYVCREDCDDSYCLVDKRACKAGCYCQRGYRRLTASGPCVKDSQCITSGIVIG